MMCVCMCVPAADKEEDHVDVLCSPPLWNHPHTRISAHTYRAVVCVRGKGIRREKVGCWCHPVIPMTSICSGHPASLASPPSAEACHNFQDVQGRSSRALSSHTLSKQFYEVIWAAQSWTTLSTRTATGSSSRCLKNLPRVCRPCHFYFAVVLQPQSMTACTCGLFLYAKSISQAGCITFYSAQSASWMCE